MTSIDEVSKDVVHHSLEGGRGVAQPEEHDSGLIESPVCLEGCLPLVTFLDANVVVPPSDVQLGEGFA